MGRRSQWRLAMRRQQPQRGKMQNGEKEVSRSSKADVWDDGGNVLFEERARLVRVHGIWFAPPGLLAGQDGDKDKSGVKGQRIVA